MTGGDWLADFRQARETLRLVNDEACEREAIQFDSAPPESTPAAQKRLVVSAADFLAEQDDPVCSLWGDAILIAGGGYLIVGGEGGVGKTIVLVGLFVSLAAGRDEYLGFRLAGERIPVLILEAEGSRSKNRERMRTVADAYGLDLAKLPVYFHARGAVLSIEQLEPMIKSSGARAVLLDPIGRFQNGDENSATDWRQGVTEPLALLAREHETAFAFNDHYVKPSDMRRARHKLRGSAAKVDDCGAALRLEYGKAGRESRVLFFDRVRDGALPDPDRRALKIDVSHGFVELDPESVAEAVADNPTDERIERKKLHESEEAQRDIEKALAQLEAGNDWNADDGVSERKLASEAGRSRTGRPFKMAMDGLRAQKAIEPTPGGGWRRVRPRSQP